MSNDRNEWLKWRREGIGSSDAPCLHNESPYKTAYKLWEEKTNEGPIEEKSSFIMNQGNELEAIARRRFAAEYNIENGTDENFDPARLELSGFPFMKASLDGFSSCKRFVVEFKFQSKSTTLTMTPGKQAHLYVRTGKVRRDYFIQVQHQLLVSGAEYAYFVSFDGATLNWCIVRPDLEFMKLHLDKSIEFWNRVINKEAPPREEKKNVRRRKRIQSDLRAV